MKSVTKIFGILSLVVLILKLCLDGYITTATAAILLFIGVIILSFSEDLSKIVISLVGFVIFVWTLSNGNIQDINIIILPVISLVMMLIGLYVMIGPLFKSSKNKLNNCK